MKKTLLIVDAGLWVMTLLRRFMSEKRKDV